MATVTPVLRTSKTNAEGTAPIYIRISDRDRSRYVSLEVRIEPKHWLDEKRRVSKRHKMADHINETIRRKVDELEEEVYRLKAAGEEPTADDLKRVSDGGPRAADFFSFGGGVVDEMRRQGQIPAAKRYESLLRKVKRFTGAPLPFDKLTPALLRDFETHMIETTENKKNTRASAFRCIRALYNKAIAQGLASQADYPFFQFKVKREVPARDKLSLDEVKAIEAIDLEEGSLIWHVRNYFLFAFYGAGIRFRDVARMEWGNVRVRDGEETLVPQALAILDRYRGGDDSGLIFPMLRKEDLGTPERADAAIQAKNALVNKYLKRVAERAGIQKRVSFHIARHSFADYARKSGASVYDISHLLAHSDLKQTDRYLKSLERNRLGGEMKRMFGAA
jgi:integrase